MREFNAWMEEEETEVLDLSGGNGGVGEVYSRLRSTSSSWPGRRSRFLPQSLLVTVSLALTPAGHAAGEEHRAAAVPVPLLFGAVVRGGEERRQGHRWSQAAVDGPQQRRRSSWRARGRGPRLDDREAEGGGAGGSASPASRPVRWRAEQGGGEQGGGRRRAAAVSKEAASREE